MIHNHNTSTIDLYSFAISVGSMKRHNMYLTRVHRSLPIIFYSVSSIKGHVAYYLRVINECVQAVSMNVYILSNVWVFVCVGEGKKQLFTCILLRNIV